MTSAIRASRRMHGLQVEGAWHARAVRFAGRGGQGEWMVPAQNYSVAVNSLVCCMFTIIAIP